MKNIVLIGYRGSGKTTLGRKLAKQLDKNFFDVDQEICLHFNDMTIAEIWLQHGEPAFRDIEAKITNDLFEKKNAVIALGGGTLMQKACFKAEKRAVNTLRIYLYCETKQLHKRIAQDSNSQATRPSLTQHNGSLEEIKTVLEQRDPVYRQAADTVVDVTDLSIDHAVSAVKKIFETYPP